MLVAGEYLIINRGIKRPQSFTTTYLFPIKNRIAQLRKIKF